MHYESYKLTLRLKQTNIYNANLRTLTIFHFFKTFCNTTIRVILSYKWFNLGKTEISTHLYYIICCLKKSVCLIRVQTLTIIRNVLMTTHEGGARMHTRLGKIIAFGFVGLL